MRSLIYSFFSLQEAAWEVADETIQVLGGMGYMKVGLSHFNSFYTNAPILLNERFSHNFRVIEREHQPEMGRRIICF